MEFTVYIYENEREKEECLRNSRNIWNLRSFGVQAPNKELAFEVANELMEVYEEYDGFGIYCIEVNK